MGSKGERTNLPLIHAPKRSLSKFTSVVAVDREGKA
jgi:hypothetical protein